MRAASFDAHSDAELVGLLAELTTAAGSIPGVEHAMLGRPMSETEPRQLGAKSWAGMPRIALRVSGRTARRRVRHAEMLGPRLASPAQRLICRRAIAAAPAPAEPCPPTGPRSTTSPTGPAAEPPTSPASSWPAAPTTAPSTTTAGKPALAQKAAPNGSHPRRWTPAKPASTTTTAPPLPAARPPGRGSVAGCRARCRAPDAVTARA